MFTTCDMYTVATKLPVLFLLQVRYMTFQYLTVSCIPAVEYVNDMSGTIPRNDRYISYSRKTGDLKFILQHVYNYLVPDIDCSRHFVVLYLDKIPTFPSISIEFSSLWLEDFKAFQLLLYVSYH